MIIAVGDHGQLPPVQGPDEEPFNLMADPDIRLEQIHRNAGDIARFAEHLRNGKPAYGFKPKDGTVLICGKDQPMERLPVMTADRVICGRNRTRAEINHFYRTEKGLDGKVVVGEKVMCLKNDADRGLYNGTLATVTRLDSTRLDLDSEEGTKEGVPYDSSQFGRAGKVELRFGQDLLPFDYGYASTCHKAQGGEWPFVLVIEEYLGFGREHGDFSMHHRWCYTAASRAQGRLVWRAGTDVYYPSYDHDRETGGAA
jgi:exodeoxyribonuclease-5